MANNPKQPIMLVGLIHVREHCIFAWQEPEGGAERSVEVLRSHCAECVDELRKRGYKLLHADQ